MTIVRPIFIEIPVKKAIEHYKISRGLPSMNSALKELLADFLEKCNDSSKLDIIKPEIKENKAYLNKKDIELK